MCETFCGYIFSTSFQLVGSLMLLFDLIFGFDNDFDFGELEDAKSNDIISSKYKRTLWSARLSFIYIVVGFVLSVIFEKPKNMNPQNAVIIMIIISCMIAAATIGILWTKYRVNTG